MSHRNLISKLNKAASKINNAGVYGYGNFLVTNSEVAKVVEKLRRRQERIEKIKSIINE
jgi:hypothetical protein